MRRASCCCRPTPTAPTSAPSSSTTARWPGPACRSSPTTTRTTPRSTSRRPCSPGCSARASSSAVKEFTGDVRRAYEIAELAPGLDLLVGSDDVTLELALAGADGWVAGYPNALPARASSSVRRGPGRRPGRALPLYRPLHPLLRWDARTEFVQAIKLSMDLAGRYGGAVPAAARAAAARAGGAASARRPRRRSPQGCDLSARAGLARRRLAHRGHAHPGRSPAAWASMPGATMFDRRRYFMAHTRRHPQAPL